GSHARCPARPPRRSSDLLLQVPLQTGAVRATHNEHMPHRLVARRHLRQLQRRMAETVEVALRQGAPPCIVGLEPTQLDAQQSGQDRKSTRLNSSHVKISY